MTTTRKKVKMQQAFEDERADYSDREIQMELLYLSRLTRDATEKTRANTSILVWIVIITIALSLVAVIVASSNI